MGVMRYIGDSITNALSGFGYSQGFGQNYGPCSSGFIPSQHFIAEAYRSSGIMRKIVRIPAMDMVREWRDWKADDEQIEKLEVLEKKLGLVEKIYLAEFYRGLGGGALILGAPGDPDKELKPDNGGLSFIHAVTRWQLSFDGQIVTDPQDPLFGGPRMWKLQQDGGAPLNVHPSRVICFKGHAVPFTANQEEAFWGESTVEQVYREVTDLDNAKRNFAALTKDARLIEVGIPGLGEMASGPNGIATLQSRFAAMAMGQSVLTATLYDSGDKEGKGGEKIEHRQVNWTGMDNLLKSFRTDVTAVADIPMTRLFGTAAEGMNASGDSQQKDWNKHVKARQELTLRPQLDILDAVLVPTAIGKADSAIWYEFASLTDIDDSAEATRFKTTMEAVEKAAPYMPEQSVNEAVQNTIVENGWMPGLEQALAKIPDDERFGLTADPSADLEEGGDLSAGAEVIPFKQAANDAAPRTLYVSRKVLNGSEILAWAKEQGFDSTLAVDDLHVTVAFSRAPIDWMQVGQTWTGDDGRLTVSPGGARLVEPLGDKGAVVLLFNASELAWRHEEIKRAGASWDWPSYQPHVKISYKAGELDLSKVEPYRGKIELGPEIFEEVVDDWEKGRE